jgi:DegV family protein with EDD domain
MVGRDDHRRGRKKVSIPGGFVGRRITGPEPLGRVNAKEERRVSVTVVTDSAAALDAVTVAAWDILVVPTQLVVGDEHYLESEFEISELFERFDEGVSTAGPTPGAFSEAFAQAGGDVLALTVAERLSSSCQAARVAVHKAQSRVRLLDTGTAAAAQALVVLEAAKAAKRGGSLDEVESAARLVADRVRFFAAFETLEYLIRGGRIDGVVGGIAERLGIRPFLQIQAGGRLRTMRPSLSRRAALNRLVRLWRRSRVEGALLHVVAAHAMALDDAKTLLDRVRAEVEPATSLISEFGPVMAVHTGPGLVGLAWWWEAQA